MKDITIRYDDFTEQKLWESFTAFFRNIKGYTDWTDENIALSMNNDDLEQYIDYVKEILGE